MRRALFVDRDGTLIEEVGLLTRPEQARLVPGVPAALRAASDAGLAIVVVTNQPVIARGLCRETDVDRVHARVSGLLAEARSPPPERFYVCPHHPEASVSAYRTRCGCRKPAPGLLHRAAEELGLDLRESFMVGDRPSDVAAGKRAGCRATFLVETGAHREPPIAGFDPSGVRPDHRCRDLAAAVRTIAGGLRA